MTGTTGTKLICKPFFRRKVGKLHIIIKWINHLIIKVKYGEG